MSSRARVSVVTPFYNTAEYLAECIESVLSQTHDNFEYLLINNCSTDGSREIAQRYAERDARIRVIDNRDFVSMLENYNGALRHIAADSKYVKVVQADDTAFPECLERMVALAEAHPSVGLVSSFYLWGRDLKGTSLDHKAPVIPGREACRRMLLDQIELTGSQTTVLYRADIVRARQPFYRVGHHFADTDTAFEILLEHDLGYVPQILTFSRKENDSTLDKVLGFDPLVLHFYISMERFGPRVLEPEELERARSAMRRQYYSYLGAQLVRMRGADFWKYHAQGLATLGQEVSWQAVIPHSLAEILRLALNPESTVERAWPWLARRLAPRGARGKAG